MSSTVGICTFLQKGFATIFPKKFLRKLKAVTKSIQGNIKYLVTQNTTISQITIKKTFHVFENHFCQRESENMFELFLATSQFLYSLVNGASKTNTTVRQNNPHTLSLLSWQFFWLWCKTTWLTLGRVQDMKLLYNDLCCAPIQNHQVFRRFEKNHVVFLTRIKTSLKIRYLG